MASTYTELKKGAQGNNVSAMQAALKNAGYDTQVNGAFDDATEAAIRQYQQANGLTVDGIAGNQTLSKLYGTEGAADSDTYTPSAAVTQAQKYLESLQQTKPGEYKNAWQDQLSGLLDRIQNREAFTYDPTNDPLYNIYKDRYIQNGRRAMQDTMGQAAALTGGYGNSYAQSVGQQQYNQYMEGLNDIVPQLQQQAWQQYQDEGNRLLQNYELVNQQENQDYSRWRGGLEDWERAQSAAQDAYNGAYDRDYNAFTGQRNWEMAVQQQQQARESELRQYAYQTAMAMIQKGKVPSGGLLNTAGISAADAKALAAAYKKKKSGGGGGKTPTQTAAEIEANGLAYLQGYDMDYGQFWEQNYGSDSAAGYSDKKSPLYKKGVDAATTKEGIDYITQQYAAYDPLKAAREGISTAVKDKKLTSAEAEWVKNILKSQGK